LPSCHQLLHRDGEDLRLIPLIERRLQLTELVARSGVHCLHLVQGFDNGAKLLEAAERHGLEGIVSKRQASAYRSGIDFVEGMLGTCVRYMSCPNEVNMSRKRDRWDFWVDLIVPIGAALVFLFSMSTILFDRHLASEEPRSPSPHNQQPVPR
jgi:hypothetical protein